MTTPTSSFGRSIVCPSHLSLSLNLRATRDPSSHAYRFDHHPTLKPQASEFTGEAYQAIDALTRASDASMQDWLISDESKSYLSNNDNFHTDTSGDTHMSSSIREGIRSTFAERVKPSLRAYRERTGKSVNLQVTFDQPPSIGPRESALQPVEGSKGPPSWFDPSPWRGSRSSVASGCEYEDEDDDLSEVEVSSDEEEEDSDSNFHDTASLSSRPGTSTRPTATSAIMSMWRYNVHTATTSGSIISIPVREPPESGFKLEEGRLPGEGVPDEASAISTSSPGQGVEQFTQSESGCTWEGTWEEDDWPGEASTSTSTSRCSS